MNFALSIHLGFVNFMTLTRFTSMRASSTPGMLSSVFTPRFCIANPLKASCFRTSLHSCGRQKIFLPENISGLQNVSQTQELPYSRRSRRSRTSPQFQDIGTSGCLPILDLTMSSRALVLSNDVTEKDNLGIDMYRYVRPFSNLLYPYSRIASQQVLPAERIH